jgi:hypothetical protein
LIGWKVIVYVVAGLDIRLKTASFIQVRRVGTSHARDAAKEYIRYAKAEVGIL